MTSPLRRLLPPLCLIVLAVPAGAAAAPVAPPGDDDGSYTTGARAAADPGCRSFNVIDFEPRTTTVGLRYAVRHAGRLRCEVPIRSRCHATLFKNGVQVSEIGDRGGRRCRMNSGFFGRAPAETVFRQNYSYRLTLRGDRRWAATNDFCPKRRNHRRTLICHDSFSTVAPNRKVDRHS